MSEKTEISTQTILAQTLLKLVENNEVIDKQPISTCNAILNI